MNNSKPALIAFTVNYLEMYMVIITRTANGFNDYFGIHRIMTPGCVNLLILGAFPHQ
jgi:hypothetical protein